VAFSSVLFSENRRWFRFQVPENRMQSKAMPSAITNELGDQYIYIACPWTPKGGGMFKVADYLIQAQSAFVPAGAARLFPLDTRGGGWAITSFFVLLIAICKLLAGRLNGQLAGVHVNMAERLSLFRKSVIVVVSRALGLPVVLHLHAAQLHHFYRKLPRPLQAMTRWVFSLASSCVVLGTTARRFVIEELRVSPEKVEIVINGVPEPTKVRRIAGSDRVQQVLFVGNLSERKGVLDLLRALAMPGFKTSRLRVCIAGGGDVPYYQSQARTLGVDGFVEFSGWSEQGQVAELMANADMLVLPSYDEGLPLVILEALANGVAVVCSPVGEIPAVFTDGHNALLISAGNIPELAAGMQRVLNDSSLRATLERNGRALYEQKFSLSRFFASVARVHQHHFGVAGVPLNFTQPSREIS
jgi:glycosyltransferase involved in cell wall biosynthesis